MPPTPSGRSSVDDPSRAPSNTFAFHASISPATSASQRACHVSCVSNVLLDGLANRADNPAEIANVALDALGGIFRRLHHEANHLSHHYRKPGGVANHDADDRCGDVGDERWRCAMRLDESHNLHNSRANNAKDEEPQDDAPDCAPQAAEKMPNDTHGLSLPLSPVFAVIHRP